MSATPRILYCHCQYAQVLPKDVKEGVLQKLCEADLPFEAVADLCELSARRDPLLKEIATGGTVKIAACFPRAVKWLFSAAGAPLDASSTEICNLRVQPLEAACDALFASTVTPNLPTGKPTA